MTESPPAAPGEVRRETCNAEDGRCPGIALEGTDRCLAHAEPSLRALALQRLADGGSVDFARGVPFTTELLMELLAAASTKDHKLVFHNADFTEASFRGNAGFAGVIFQGAAHFTGASFDGEARF